MIADDRRPYCDLRSAIIWKPALSFIAIIFLMTSFNFEIAGNEQCMCTGSPNKLEQPYLQNIFDEKTYGYRSSNGKKTTLKEKMLKIVSRSEPLTLH